MHGCTDNTLTVNSSNYMILEFKKTSAVVQVYKWHGYFSGIIYFYSPFYCQDKLKFQEVNRSILKYLHNIDDMVMFRK